MKNKRWTIYAKSIVIYQTEVNAFNEEEAIEKAEKIDASEWIENENCGNFEIVEAKPFDILKLK
jgi:hypothetical protein